MVKTKKGIEKPKLPMSEISEMASIEWDLKHHMCVSDFRKNRYKELKAKNVTK